MSHIAFYLTFALIAIPLYWSLPALFEAAGLTWHGDYTLRAAVPVALLTVLARFLAKKHLRD